MDYFSRFKKWLRKPKKYVEGKKVGHKAVEEQRKKREQMNEINEPVKPPKRKKD
jgi:cytochrome c2